MDDGLLRELQDAIRRRLRDRARAQRGRHVARPPGYAALARAPRRDPTAASCFVSGVSETRFQREILVMANLHHPHRVAWVSARMFYRVGKTDLAIDKQEQLLNSPLWVSAANLDSLWTPLKKNPRFQRILAKSATN